MIKMDGF
jgi:hypothetical protein